MDTLAQKSGHHVYFDSTAPDHLIDWTAPEPDSWNGWISTFFQITKKTSVAHYVGVPHSRGAKKKQDPFFFSKGPLLLRPISPYMTYTFGKHRRMRFHDISCLHIVVVFLFVGIDLRFWSSPFPQKRLPSRVLCVSVYCALWCKRALSSCPLFLCH